MANTMRRIAPRPEDTSEEAERVQVNLLRASPIERRLELAWSLTASVITAARQGLERADPGINPAERDIRFVELHYGTNVAEGLRADFRRRRESDVPTLR